MNGEEMQDLKVTLIQANLYWEEKENNFEMFNRGIDSIGDKSDLLILPEMFSTGFSMCPDRLFHTMDGKAVNWMKEKARLIDTDITGSLIIKEEEKYYNRLIWVKPDGSLFYYDKKHLFRYAGEDEVYTAGSSAITVELKGWKIKPFICYDLRFPLWTRNLDKEYDLAIFVANWPERRSEHWKALLKARAIENQCYVIGVNRVGVDGNKISHSGDSSIIDPTGTVVESVSDDATIIHSKLSMEHLTSYREQFPAWMDGDVDLVKK